MTAPRTVSLIGSTGSIGTQAIDVVRAYPDRYRVVALGAASSVELLARQAQELRPERVAIAEESLAGALESLVPAGTEVWAGAESLTAIAGEADVAINGVVGFAGLGVTVAALAAGRRLGLANKESLIAGGPVVQAVRNTPGAEIVPVDSEHSAVHQCLRAAGPRGLDRVARIVLTASGGPFRGRKPEDLAKVTAEEALAHPTWRMGPKITVDSSTLMNKGLEVIEANELFGVGFDRIEVVVHPESIVHSMVEFSDGATVAQLSCPDMRLPIGYALAYPDRLSQPVGRIDWAAVASLNFEPPDTETFSCLRLAYEAGRAGGTVPAWLNGANEVANAAFLQGRIAWCAIPWVIEEVLSAHDGAAADSIGAVVEADQRARRLATAGVERRATAA